MEQRPFTPYSQISTMPGQHPSQQNQMPWFIFGGNNGGTFPPSLSGPYQSSYTSADMRQSTEQRGQNMRNRLLNHFESKKKEFCQALRSRTYSNYWTNDPYRAVYNQPSNTGYFATNSNLTNLSLGKENYFPAGNQTSVVNAENVQYSRIEHQNIAHSNMSTSQVSTVNPVRSVLCKSSQTSNLQFSKSQSTQTCAPCLTNSHKRSRSTQIDKELPNVIFVPIHPGHPYYPSQYYNHSFHQHRPQTQAAALARQVPVQTDRPTPPEDYQVISKSDCFPQNRSQSRIVSKPSCPVGLVKPQSRQPDSQTSRIVPDDQLPSVTPVSEEHLQKLMHFNSSAAKTKSSDATHQIKTEPMEHSHSAADLDQRISTKPKNLCKCGSAFVNGSCKTCIDPPKSSVQHSPEVKKEEEVYEPIYNPEQLPNNCPDATKNAPLNIQASDSTSISTSDNGIYDSLSKVPSPWQMSASEAVAPVAAPEVNNHFPTLQFKEPPYSESEELDWDSDEDMIFPVEMTRNLVQHDKPRLRGYLSFDGNVLEYHPLSKGSSRTGTDSSLVSRQRRTVKKRRCPCCDDNPGPLKKAKHDIRIVDISGDVERCQKLTDYFPVRRSKRQPLSKIKDLEYEQLKEKILNKCTDGLEIRQIEGKGRGVFSTRHFERKEFIVEYSGTLISYEEAKKREAEYVKEPEKYGCYMYYFVFKNKKYCVDGTAEDGSYGRLLNHSKNGNVESKLVNINSKPVLVLVAKQDIEPKTELCYDYGERSKEIIDSHPWLNQ